MWSLGFEGVGWWGILFGWVVIRERCVVLRESCVFVVYVGGLLEDCWNGVVVGGIGCNCELVVYSLSVLWVVCFIWVRVGEVVDEVMENDVRWDEKVGLGYEDRVCEKGILFWLEVLSYI